MRIPLSQYGLIALLNCGPLLATVLFGWSAFEVLLLYWLENIVIGLVQIPRLLCVADSSLSLHNRLFKTAFFCVHYGIFCIGHGHVLLSILADHTDAVTLLDAVMLQLDKNLTLISIVGFGIVHLFGLRSSLYTNNELGDNFNQVMKAPYQRIIVLHIALIGGGIIATKLTDPTYLLILLIAIKIGADIYHSQRRERASSPAQHTGSNTDTNRETTDDWNDADGA